MSRVELPESSLNFPSNYEKPSGEVVDNKPKIKKIVKGNVKIKKRSFGRKFADIFFGEEIVDVKGYILQDVLIPAIKDTISDIITGGSDMLLFGERRLRGGRRPSNGAYTSYSSYYQSGSKNNPRTRPSGSYSGSRCFIKDIIFETRGEAEDVLGNMIDVIKDYGMVSVADLYDMVDEPGQFTDNSWGWSDLGSASVRRVAEGYMLVLPKVISLK